MTVQARLPDGTTLEFPDGTDPAVIQRTVKRQLGVAETPAAPAAAPERSPVERAVGNFVDQAARAPLVSTLREAFTSGNPGLAANMPIVGPLWSAAAGAGQLAEHLKPGIQKDVVQGEAARRARQDATAASDPFYKAGDGLGDKLVAGAATAAGSIAGSMTDPTAWLTPGKTLIQKMLGQGAINAAGDVAAQGADMGAGVQKDYIPEQTAVSGAIGVTIPALAHFFTRGGRAQPGTPEAVAEEAQVAAAISDPNVRAQLEASGITPQTSPRYAELAAKAQAVQEARTARAADPNANAEPPTYRPPAQPPAAPAGSAEAAAAVAGDRVDQVAAYRQGLADAFAEMEARTQMAPGEPGRVDPAALPTAGREPPAPEQPLRVTPEGQAFEPDAGALRGQELRRPSNLPVVQEPQVRPMDDGEIARARARMNGGNLEGAHSPGPVAPEPLPARPDAQLRGGDLPPERSVTYAPPEGQAFDQRANATGAAPVSAEAAPARGVAENPATEVAPLPAKGDPGAVPVGASDPASPIRPAAGGDIEPAVGGRVAGTERPDAATVDNGGQAVPTPTDAAEPVARLRGDEIAPHDADIKQVRAAAKTWFETNLRGKSVRSEALGRDVKFLNPRKSLSASAKPEKLRLFPALPEMIEKGKLLGTSPADAEASARGVKAYHFLEGRAEMGGVEHRATINVREDRNGHIYYNHGLEDEAVPPKGSPTRTDDGGFPSGADRPEETAIKRGREEPVAQATDNVTPPAPSDKGGAKLYSNPLDPEAVDDLLVKPLKDVVNKELAAAKKDKAWLDRAFSGIDRNPKAIADDAVQLVMRTVREGAMSGAGALRSYASKYKDVPEIRELADALATDPGSGRAVAEPYEMAAARNAQAAHTRAANVIEDWKKAGVTSEQIRRAMTGQARPADAAYARRLRAQLDQHLKYLRESGLEVGEAKDFFPRNPDAVKVEKDPAGFVKAAEAVYRAEGEANPRAAAEAWRDEILTAGDLHVQRSPGGTLTTKSTRERTFKTGAADKQLAPFMQDAEATLADYFARTSRYAEFARRFGASGEKLDTLLEGMIAKGVDPKDLNSIRFIVDGSTGLLPATRPNAGSTVLNWVHAIYTMRLLARSVSASIAEPFVAAVRTGDVGLGLRALGDYVSAPFDKMDRAEWRDRSELLGILGDINTEALLLRRAGADGMNTAQKVVLGRFFRTMLVHPITEFQFNTVARLADWHLRSTLRKMDDAPARRQLADLYGLDEAGSRSLLQWMDGFGDKAPPVSALLGKTKGGEAYGQAIHRFVNETIQNPNRIDKPAAANDPRLRAMYGITTFMFSFTRKVLMKMAKDAAGIAGSKDFSAGQKAAALLGPSLAYGLYTAMQYGIWNARDHVLNPQSAQERTKSERFYTALSQGQVFGNAAPLIDMTMSAVGRYDRDLSSVYAGPQFTTAFGDLKNMVKGLQGGSDETNNTEWQGVKSGYNALAVNSLLLGTQFIPTGPLGRLGIFALDQAASAPGTGRAVADAVVGERTVKPRVDNVDNKESTTPNNSAYGGSYGSDYAGKYQGSYQ